MLKNLLYSPILLLVSAAASGQIPVHPADYEIAFYGSCQASSGICLMRSDGSAPRLLRLGQGSQILLSWSPDGRKILISDRDPKSPSQTRVRVIDVHGDKDGRGDEVLPVQLIGLDYQVVWSPDSTRLAFASAFEDPHLNNPEVQRGRQLYSTAIYVLNIQTKKLSKLSPLGQNRWISWAPDGHRIAFSGTAPGELRGDIYVVESDGGTPPRRIFSGPTQSVQPSWSPQGDQIAFLATASKGGGLYVVHPDGTAPRQVAPFWGPTVAWSPDARFLVTGSTIVNVTTGATVDLGKEYFIDVTFTPDGRSVIYRTADQGRGTISSINIDGTNRHKLADGFSFVVSPLRRP
jgi:Tol biopolymer transport system component